MNSLNNSEHLILQKLLMDEIFIINVGLDLFSKTFDNLEIAHVSVDWQPPAEGDQNLNDILAALR